VKKRKKNAKKTNRQTKNPPSPEGLIIMRQKRWGSEENPFV